VFCTSICVKVQPMSEGSDSVPLFMASVFSVKVLTLWTHVLGRKILLLLQGTWALPR
jgi:hypothetical protein